MQKFSQGKPTLLNKTLFSSHNSLHKSLRTQPKIYQYYPMK